MYLYWEKNQFKNHILLLSMTMHIAQLKYIIQNFLSVFCTTSVNLKEKLGRI